jgi:hypothetical protein
MRSDVRGLKSEIQCNKQFKIENPEDAILRGFYFFRFYLLRPQTSDIRPQ